VPPSRDPALRRRLILSVLLGEISQGEAERRSGMAQGSMSRAVASVKRGPEAALLDAEEEAKFRRRVAEILSS
jgi:hypothetical protein